MEKEPNLLRNEPIVMGHRLYLWAEGSGHYVIQAGIEDQPYDINDIHYRMTLWITRDYNQASQKFTTLVETLRQK